MRVTRLVFQNPGSEPSLLTTLLGALPAGSAAGGIFAWTNTYGIAAFLGSDIFQQFIKAHPFALVVGTDSITNEAALDALIELDSRYGQLAVQMFVHDRNVLFHPKMAWVETSTGVRLLVGSGNLTRGGLQASWEIFTDSALEGEDAETAVTALHDWHREHANYLLDLSDPRVREAVKLNVPSERSLRQRPKTGAKESAKPITPAPKAISATGNAVLATELPKNRKNSAGESMFSQANFTKELFETYFSVENNTTELLLVPVDSDGSLGELETRLGRFKEVSVNYYFELAAASGLAHPGVAPIAVFLRLDTGAYLYLFRLAGEPGFTELSTLLNRFPAAQARQMRRGTMSAADLEQAWPDCPLLKASEPPL